VRPACVVLLCTLFAPVHSQAQGEEHECRFLCSPAFTVEPTFTITNLFGSPRVVADYSPSQ